MVDAYAYTRETNTDHSSLQYSHSNPSFSSTLLDAIYRSIDQGEEDQVLIYREPMRKKQTSNYTSDPKFQSQEQMANFQRACMIEKWMEKKAGERRKPDLQMKKPRKARENSVSSSSDSSCGGGGGGGGFFSSSEAESFPVQRPKPIRTGGSGFEKEKFGKSNGDSDLNRRERRGYGGGDADQKPKHEGGFLKTKSRALKIYGDLKKVKQPISPGGKLAGFLNSLFTAGNLKKPKTSTKGADDSPSLKSTNASTCSSASSFSRSCLSKTPSSRGKPFNGAKRSVHFSPVSVIVDDGKNYSKKQTPNTDAAKNNINSIRTVINEELMLHVMEKNRRVEEVARDLLRNYQRKNQVGCEFELSFDHLRKAHVKDQVFDHDFDDEEEEEDDDAASCASSDLFELDNLSAIGMERYREELPVYETTHLGKNRAVANGLIL